jgi:hypothetical protein
MDKIAGIWSLGFGCGGKRRLLLSINWPPLRNLERLNGSMKKVNADQPDNITRVIQGQQEDGPSFQSLSGVITISVEAGFS